MKNYDALEKHFSKNSALIHMMSILGWDEQVNMPSGGGEARANASAEMSSLLHERIVDPQIAEWIENIEASEWDQLSDWQKSNIREIKSSHEKSKALNSDLVEKLARARSLSQQKWGDLRAANDWKSFLPIFKDLLELTREEADQRAASSCKSPYDSLIELYDPGFSTDLIERNFTSLKDYLPELINSVIEKQASEPVIKPKGTYPIEKQKALGLELMKAVGFDFERGRLDVSLHPFCGGVPQDVRLTTCYNESDFTESLMGVLHETGHASYEQGLPKEWLHQPVGDSRGMSIHEGQSLLFEMQMSRSSEFLKFALPIMKKHLGDCGDSEEFWSLENIQALYTRVEKGFIRVHADEVTYPAHILLRFEAEKKLISRELQAEDLPDFWNSQMEELLGLSTKGNDKDGCMQDVHWPSGAFGYFPSYTLGAMTAAQLFQCAKAKNPKMLTDIENGKFSTLTSWLEKNVWSKGSSLSSEDLLISATGESLNPKHFETHLRERYL